MSKLESRRSRCVKPPRVSGWRVVCWYIVYVLAWIYVKLFYRMRWWGTANVPRRGPTLIVASHQSFLDPLLVGTASWHRPFFSLARASLWNSRFVGGVINILNAIPIDQAVSDLRALRTAVDLIKSGETLLLFPEGSRTVDGTVGPFEPGMLLLVRRARPTVVPAAIEGAFDVWPIHQKRPHLYGRIGIMFGAPISAEDLLARDTDEALIFLQQEVEKLRQEVGRRIDRGPVQSPKSSEDREAADGANPGEDRPSA